MSSATKPSSANVGFFQAIPEIENQFHDDWSFQRVMKLFLPVATQQQISSELETFGSAVLSKRVFDWVTDAERNVPYLKGSGRDAFGKRTSELVVGEGWRELQRFGIGNGIVKTGYVEHYGDSARVVQYLKAHLWTGSCANVTCPSAMTDGAAKLLNKHLSSPNLSPQLREIFQEAYNHLTSSDPNYAWTSGQWMTERSGGSDVSKTETIATYSPNTATSSLGPWNINGFKWFSSATDSNMAILLAQTPKGLSTFLAPMRLPSSHPKNENGVKQLNGIHIQRLKTKFGTKSLPTAELELINTRAHLIGSEGQGIQEISTILNISRLWSAVTAVGYLGRGVAIVKSWAKVRAVGKTGLLKDSPLFMNTLSKVVSEYHKMMLLTFFVAFLVGLDEHPSSPSSTSSNHRNRLQPESSSDVSLLLRILTPILKATVCKKSITNLQECMEALGGVGYLDNAENESMNIARLYRDCCVLSIWEGTTDVLASDTIRVLKGKRGKEVLQAMERWIENCIGRSGSRGWDSVKRNLDGNSVEDLMPGARGLVFEIADVVVGALLVVDMERDGDEGVQEILRSAGVGHFGGEGGVNSLVVKSAKEGLALDQRLVYGIDQRTVEKSKL